jgi:hypothetical protein
MPISDNRTPWTPPAAGRTKRKLGKRDAAAVDTDQLLGELSREAVSAVARVLAVGGSIQFGSTRDRSAMLVRAWIGGDVYEDYCTAVVEFVATLEALDAVCEAVQARDPRPFRPTP